MTMYDSSHKRTQKVKALVLLATITSLGLFVDYLFEEPLLPKVNQSQLLGFRSADRSIREYNINISDEIVSTVFSQVKHSAIHSQPLETAYGRDTKTYKDVINYWIEKYEWRSREMYFNQYPQYTTIVQGLRIHFVHVKPEQKSNKTMRLLMLHGWPESFTYFYDVVPQLTAGNGDVSFELIIPSLPGHFISDAVETKDGTTVHVATLFKNLMERLNIDRFYVFGQGLGSFIATDMAILYPDNVRGLYNTMCLSLRKISLVKYASEMMVSNADKSKHDLWKSFNKLLHSFNYLQEHYISLDSLSVTLSSSPIALASYVWNIISIETEFEDNNKQLFGGINKMDEDKLIDTVMLMTVSQSTTNSIRSFKQLVSMPLYQYPISRKIPCSCPKFTKHLFYQPFWIYKDKFTNVVQATHLQESGQRMLLQSDKRMKYKLSKDIFASIKKMIDSN